MPLYPKKNLMPTLDTQKYNDGYSGIANTVVDNKLAVMSYSSSHFGYGVWVDVEINKPYTFSTFVEQNLEGIPGLLRIGYGDKTSELVSSPAIIGDYSVTFTPTQPKVFVRFSTSNTKSLSSPVYFGKIQLELGAQTLYEPYELGMKKDNWKKDIVYPGISGSSHVATAADVFAPKRDVRVGKAQISIATTGVFKVAIYEWADSVGRIGDPIYQKDTTYDSTGVYTYDFGGVLLKAGKNYWIGRYEDTGGASANRTLSAVIPNETYKHVTWLGGTSFTSSTMAYPTTYYYFYGLEFEVVDMKKAPLLPERNMIPDFNDPRWSYDKKLSVGGTSMKVDADNPHRGTLTVGISAQSWLIQIPVKSGKTYTFQFGSITGLYRLLKGWTDSYNNVPIVGQDSKVLRITPDDTYNGYVTLRLTHGAAGDYRFEDLLMVEGDYTTVQQFTPYTPVKMKPALTYSKGAINLPPDSSVWQLRSGTTYVRKDGKRYYFDSSADYSGTQIIFTNMGIPDSVFQGKEITFGGNVHPMATVMFYYKKPDGTPTYIGVSKVTDNGARVMTVPYGATECRLYVQSDVGGRGELWFEDVFVKLGSDKSFQPYELGLKPAILYPKKNYILPYNMNPWTFSDSSLVPKPITDYPFMAVAGEYAFTMTDKPVGWQNAYFFVEVEPDTKFTYSNKFEGWTGQSLRIDAFKADKVTSAGGIFNGSMTIQASGKGSYTFTTGSDTKFIRVILQNNAAGTYKFSEFQLEKGPVATDFEFYKLGMKQ